MGECYQGDVNATYDFGFESIKLDSCGVENNVRLLSQLFNASGKRPVLIDNCHNGVAKRRKGVVDCPMNLFAPRWTFGLPSAPS